MLSRWIAPVHCHAAPLNIFSVAPDGANSRASTISAVPLGSRMLMKPPPPMPDAIGLKTPSHSAVVTHASAALPPRFMMLRPGTYAECVLSARNEQAMHPLTIKGACEHELNNSDVSGSAAKACSCTPYPFRCSAHGRLPLQHAALSPAVACAASQTPAHLHAKLRPVPSVISELCDAAADTLNKPERDVMQQRTSNRCLPSEMCVCSNAAIVARERLL